ncbi:sulfurtransferase TusA family protein [Thermaurantiacus sp.]
MAQPIKTPLPERQVDARGLRCPLPALRLARAVRAAGGGRYRLLADDPAALSDIPALCNERGWRLVTVSGNAFLVEVPGEALR